MASVQPKTRTFAGVALIDTPLVNAALQHARAIHDDMSFNHIHRSWVFGALIASKLPNFAAVDLEVHAVSAILHDLAWDYKSTFSTPDKRFEVDGANAAREFLGREAPDWDSRKRQLVWDAIALHTTSSIAKHKEPEVALCHFGIFADFIGPAFPGGIISKAAFSAVIEELPRLDFKEGVKQILCNLCKHKPETTYDSFAREFGIRFVDGYEVPSELERILNALDATAEV
ncbi:hypothetical protein OIDMADRAFT_136469 [Oidiodendron maius Zn]|uniref:HD domain-containing protein n=1 Tax=Oidiodendron maius (strain Zn) TaxID=913774 RepID=A0A0C3GRR3_OIDMZ|nr:hypothetical protein OIDMADRAFT_136469 [Oidiodendron maius Zn]